MKLFLGRSTKNWLFYLGIISILFASIYAYVVGEDMVKSSRNYSDMSLEVVLILVLILAPIIEEFIFRGLFTGRKWMKIVSLILIPLIVLASDNGWLDIVLLLLFVIAYFLNQKYPSEYIRNLALLANVLLFAAVHYKMEEIIDPELFYFAFFQIGLGSLLLWSIVNFGIIQAIVLHFAWNATLMIFMFYNLHYVDASLNVYENSDFKVEWKRVPRFNSKSSSVRIVNEDSIIANNIEARELYQLLDSSNESDSGENIRLLQTEGFMKYDFEIISKKTGKQSIKREALGFLEIDLIYRYRRK
ncbi:CPBP family intramembrane glutamic endopeptidase [Christiangramia echinicola]|uniref:CPBP family intramembrane glutamic endopeptidase n=1 Tax=Christiangramia echinicola TaxID=279359 RepID=UPI0003FD73BE|nr:CPBP family intramembrane glutamic endopeptidase [Christiangramia echinicola]